MNENALEVLEQYDLEVYRFWKGRGVYFLDTSSGLYMLKEHRGSEEKMEKKKINTMILLALTLIPERRATS